MRQWKLDGMVYRLFLAVTFAIGLSACSGTSDLPPAPKISADPPLYIIGSGDSLQIFVWRNPELSRTVTVRPDGRVSIPLIEDLPASGKSTTNLARDVEKALSTYIKNPVVTVIVGRFIGIQKQSIRIVGEAATPRALSYSSHMTVLDAMISVGGLTKFAAGNRAVIVRNEKGKQVKYAVRLDDLLKNGDISANAALLPGDILIIPQSWF